MKYVRTKRSDIFNQIDDLNTLIVNQMQTRLHFKTSMRDLIEKLKNEEDMPKRDKIAYLIHSLETRVLELNEMITTNLEHYEILTQIEENVIDYTFIWKDWQQPENS